MKKVLITGATSGIGFEFAKRYAQDNFHLILVSSSLSNLIQTKETLELSYSVPIDIYQKDLSLPNLAKELFEELQIEHPLIDVVINNAGFGLTGPTDEIDLQQDIQLIQLNVTSLVTLCKLFLPVMYQAQSGTIVNVASIAAYQPGPYSSTYFASKAFVLSYSESIHYEAKKHGVLVHVLSPGTTKTQFFTREGVKTPKMSMSASKVVDLTYRNIARKRKRTVPGLINQVIIRLPRNLKTSFGAKINQKRIDDSN